MAPHVEQIGNCKRAVTSKKCIWLSGVEEKIIFSFEISNTYLCTETLSSLILKTIFRNLNVGEWLASHQTYWMPATGFCSLVERKKRICNRGFWSFSRSTHGVVMSFGGECGSQSGPPPNSLLSVLRKGNDHHILGISLPCPPSLKKYHLLKCMHIKKCLILSSARSLCFLHLLVLLCLLLLSSLGTDILNNW